MRVTALDTLQQPLRLRAAGRRWQVTLEELGQRSHAVSAVNKALGVGDTMGTFSRFWHRFNDEPIDREIEPAFSGHARVDAVLRRIAKDVAVRPVNADLTYDDGRLVLVKPKPGRALDFVEARAAPAAR